MRWHLHSAIILALLIVFTSSIEAQTYRATIRGSVKDQNGAVVPGAELKLTSEETNEIRSSVSGSDGEYSFAALPAGSYLIEIAAKGFATYGDRIQVSVNQEARFDVELAAGGTIDPYMVVIHDSLELKKDTPALGTVINNSQVTGLPLDGRNFYELNLLVPGAVPSAQGSAGSVRGDFAFSVNGAREDANNFLLDGVYNVDPKLNTFAVRPSVDAIREYEMLTSTYDASFGRNPGAQVNVVLKSGSNEFHGSAYEFFRNGALDARNYFAPADVSKPQYQRNQFGFSLGAPLKKDKTFFFADYEGTRAREGITRIANVPTLAARNGDLSAYLPPTTVVAANNTSCNPIRLDNGQPFINTPSQFIICNIFLPMPQAFTGNIIPAPFINPIGRAIAGLYPAPNRNVQFQNFVSSPSLRDRNDTFDARIDHVMSESSTWVLRYSFGDRSLFEPFTGPGFSLVPGYGADIPRRSQNFMFGETHLFSPNLVNEARIAFSRVAIGVFQEGFGTSTNRAVGMPELSSNPRDFGLSFITISGYSPIGDEANNPQQSVTNTYQILDNASYVRDKHFLKFGIDFRFVQQNGFRDVQSRGFLNFIDSTPQGQLTGNALADLLIGFPLRTGGARVDNAQHLRTESYDFFISDSYRITPNLTITAGLRYEYNSPPVDTFDRANIYDQATQSLVPVGTNGVPRSGFESDKNNFAPRIGFAWSPGSEGKTVIRGGYGVYYDQSPLAPGEALYFNAPYFDFNLFFPLPGLPLTVNNPFPNNFPFPLPDSALAIQRDFKTPYMQHWNFNVQRQIDKNSVLEVAYVGSKGTKLVSARDINQPLQPSPLPFNPRPVQQFADINILESRANSNYNSLQVKFQRRLSQGLQVLAAYTWSKSIDNASNFFTSAGDPNFPQDSYNVNAERGRSNFDVRQRLSISYSYDLPFGKGQRYLSDGGFVTSFLTGWQTMGIITLQTGRPFTVALPTDFDNSNTGFSSLGFGANDRPNIIGDPHLQLRTPEQWFNTAAFALPPFGNFGSAGRNILDGPGYQNVNASLVKNTSLTERINLQIRAEFFNLFNHPNFALPDNFFGSPTFGQILSAQSPRHIQFGAKILF